MSASQLCRLTFTLYLNYIFDGHLGFQSISNHYGRPCRLSWCTIQFLKHSITCVLISSKFMKYASMWIANNPCKNPFHFWFYCVMLSGMFTFMTFILFMLVWSHLWRTAVLSQENTHFCLKSWYQEIIFSLDLFWIAHNTTRIGPFFRK